MISNEYAAGFFDGEGSVYAAVRNGKTTRPHPTIMICISNTHEGVLLLHKERWGGSIHKRSVVKDRHKQIYQWALAPKGGRQFLADVYPHLIIKKDVAKVAMEMLELVSLPRHVRCIQERIINADGPDGTRPVIRPEHSEKVWALHASLRELNVRGAPFNAMRARA